MVKLKLQILAKAAAVRRTKTRDRHDRRPRAERFRAARPRNNAARKIAAFGIHAVRRGSVFTDTSTRTLTQVCTD